MVTVEDLRFFLKNMPEDFVSDETIELQIDLAEWFVDKHKSAEASNEDIDKTILVRSAYFVTLAYMQEAERALGVIPPGLGALVRELEKLQEEALQIVARGNIFSISLSLAGLSDSMWDYVPVTGSIKLSTNGVP